MDKKKAIIAFFALSGALFWLQVNAEEKPISEQLSLGPPVEYKAEGLPEPFQLKEEELEAPVKSGEELEAEAKLPDLTIQGVIWGSRSPQAIINNQIVKIGDKIEGVSIVDIAKEGLTVSFQGKEFKLPSPGARSAGPGGAGP